MRNPTLHALLQAFTTDASMRLSLAAADGDEIPFEVVESDSGRVPLYCYRPLTGAFIRSHLGLLVALPTYAPAARGLESCEGTAAYLRARGETRIPDAPRERADAALRCFLARVFEERSEFGFDDARFGRCYAELERSLYDGLTLVEVVGVLHGVELAAGASELALGDGLALMPPEALADPPPEADLEAGSGTGPGTGPGADRPPHLLLVLRLPGQEPGVVPVTRARARLRGVLTALRLFDRGACTLAAVGFARVDGGEWTPLALGAGGRAGPPLQVGAESEDELRAFVNLMARRMPGAAADSSGAGELPWALRRFELGCERASALEALTDHLLALRALLEPEGPASGRLAQRLAVICAPPEERARLAERAARAIALERAIVAGLAHDSAGAVALAGELAEHLRAILRDVLCGHLDHDLCRVADELLAASVG